MSYLIDLQLLLSFGQMRFHLCPKGDDFYVNLETRNWPDIIFLFSVGNNVCADEGATFRSNFRQHLVGTSIIYSKPRAVALSF